MDDNLQTPAIPVPEQSSTVVLKKSFFSSKLFILIIILVVLVVGSASAAYLNLKSNISETNQILKISPTPIDETANWKTYTNKEFGFELKYFKYGQIIDYNGKLSEDQRECGNSIKEESGILRSDPVSNKIEEPVKHILLDNLYSIFIYKWDQKIDDFIKANGAEGIWEWKLINIQDAEEGLLKGKQISNTPSPAMSYVSAMFRKKDYLILFAYSQNPGNYGGCLFSELDKESNLSWEEKFKFTDEMANWKTYTSTKYGIELQYPGDLLVERKNACSLEYLYPNQNEVVNLFLRKIDKCTPDMPSPIAIYKTDNFDYPTSSDECYLVQKTTTVIDGIEAMEYTIIFNPNKSEACTNRGIGPSFSKQIDIFLSKNGKNFEIIYGSKNRMIGVDGISEETLNKIISSIKFTN